MIESFTKNLDSGAYGHPCLDHSIHPDFSQRLVSWPKWSLFHDIKNLKVMYNSSRHGVQATDMGLLGKGKKSEAEQLWQELFSNPSEWWDQRLGKVNPRFPDFKHKKTKESLWLDSKWNPPWVEAKLTTIAAGTLEPYISSWNQESELPSGGSTKSSRLAWNQEISRSAKAGQHKKTLELYEKMQKDGISPNRFTFAPVLSACASLKTLEEGRRIHTEISQNGFESDLFVGSSLINMYGKCGCMKDAERVFKKMPGKNVVTWNAMMLGYVKCGKGQQALQLYKEMQQEHMDPDPITFMAVLNACASVAALEEGRAAHEEIIRRGHETNFRLINCLVDMYCKCGSIEDAKKVFEKVPTRNVVTWTSMIMGYVTCGEGQQALQLYREMQQDRVDPNPVTYMAVLDACASVAALEDGRVVHEDIIQRGYKSNVCLNTCLVDMYSKCGSIEDAEKVFKKMPTRDVVAWNAMILGYVRCRKGQQSLELYQQMQQEHVDPNAVTFMAVLNACASVAALDEGRSVHEDIIRRGYKTNARLSTCLVDMYGKCGSIEDAEKVFKQMLTKDVVVWNAMILGCVKCGEGEHALELYQEMQREDVDPNPVTFMVVLNACASVVALEEGRVLHKEIIRRGYETVGLSTCLVDMYGKCGSIEDAVKVFKHMPTRDVVVWNAMLAAYARHGYAKDALEHFKQMCEIVEVNAVTFISLLTACIHGGFVDEGLEYFKSMSTRYNISPTVEHYARVVNLLGRTNRLREAEDLIMSMPMDPNATVWMFLLGACKAHVNVELGERCARRVLELEPECAAAYVLLADISVAAGEREDSARVQQEKLDRSLKKTPGCTWIEVNNNVHSFVVDDSEHSQIKEIRAQLKRLACQIMDAEFVPDTRFFLRCVDDERKESNWCPKSTKLAIAFGLINTTPGTPLFIFKNSQMCGNCHTATKFVAHVAQRAVIVRDSNNIHHFEGGLCSCRNYW